MDARPEQHSLPQKGVCRAAQAGPAFRKNLDGASQATRRGDSMNSSCGEDESIPLARKLARKIADNAPFSTYLIIQALTRINNMSRSNGIFTESLAASMSQTTDGAKEGFRAFLEKRPPKFS